MSNEAQPQKRWNPLRRLYDWIMRHAEARNAWWILAGLSFAESSFFPMPPDVLLIPMIMANRGRAFQLGLWTALWSVLGGILGYEIGHLLYNSVGQWLISVYGMGNDIAAFRDGFHKYGYLIVFQGLLPIPYKLVSIASGFADFPIWIFLALSGVTRTIRFTLVSAVLFFIGEPARAFIEKYLELVVLVFLVVVVLGYLMFKHLF